MKNDQEIFINIWKPVKGYEQHYLVSTFGEIKSLDRIVPTKSKKGLWSKRLLKGRSLNPSYGKNRKYRLVNLLKEDTKKYMAKMHRLVAVAFIPNPHNKPEVNHIDGNTLNNKITNLEWCTHKENMQHAYANGLTPEPPTYKGSKSNFSKLTEQQVIEIKKRLRNGDKTSLIVKSYPVGESCIKEIKAGRSWAHIA